MADSSVDYGRPLSPFWSRAMELAQGEAIDWGMSFEADFCASLLFHGAAARDWRPFRLSSSALAQMLSLPPRLAAPVLSRVEAAGYVRVTADPESGRLIEWIGPRRA